MPKIHTRKFLLDEAYTPVTVSRTVPEQESTIGLRFLHESYDTKNAKKSEWSLKNAYKPKESEFLKVFTDREDDNLSPKKIKSGIVLEADYRSKLKEDKYFRFKK